MGNPLNIPPKVLRREPMAVRSINRPTAPIVVGMATIAGRQDAFLDALDSLLMQTWLPTHLHVYWNGPGPLPDYLTALHDSRTVFVHDHNKTGDRGSVGKFYGMSLLASGYCLTVDDDIHYPPDYIEQVVTRIEHYRRRAVVCLHGLWLHPPITGYRDCRVLLSFAKGCWNDIPVHVPGTGTVGWHTDTIRLTVRDFPLANMDDPQLGVLLHRRGLLAVAMARRPRWLTQLEVPKETTIGSRRKKDDSRETACIRQIEWPSIEALRDRLDQIVSENQGILVG